MQNDDFNFEPFNENLNERGQVRATEGPRCGMVNVLLTGKRVDASTPYCIKIINNGKKEHVASFFGFNKFSHLDNFGNHKDIKLESLYSEVSYGEIMNQSAWSPFKVGALRISS